MSKTLSMMLLAALLSACKAGPERGPTADDRYAIIYTGASRLSERIFPVLIDEIDGRRIVEREYYKIKPGEHSIKARAEVVDRGIVGGIQRDISEFSDEPLVHNFVSGKRYFIGLKADSSRREDWRLVIWKEEEIVGGVIDLE